MFRYTMVSVISTLVSVTVLALVYGVFQWWYGGAEHLVRQRGGDDSLVLPEPLVGMGQDRTIAPPPRGLPFWGLSIAGMLLSILTSTEARNIGIAHFDHHHAIRTVLVLGANLLAFGVLWVVKFLVFNRLFHVSPSRRGRRDGGSQSLKFVNCRGMPKSSSLSAWMTAWRSSRFFPDTRSWSPCVCEDTPLAP